MSQSKQPCPFCERPVGGVHIRSCSRSAMYQADRAMGTKVLAHLHRNAFVFRSGMLLTKEELDKLPDEVKVWRTAWARPKRRNHERAHRVEAVTPKGVTIPLFYVRQQGTLRGKIRADR